VYIDRINADLKRKISHFAYLPCGIALVIFSSFFAYIILYGGFRQVGLNDVIVVSFLLFLLYATGFFMFYMFFRYGYPTSYVLNSEGVKILFHQRQLTFIPYYIIERVVIDEEGLNIGRIMIGLGNISDLTARKCKKYVAIETPVFTYYLSPSDPEKFKAEIDCRRKITITFEKENLLKARSQVQISKVLSLKNLLLLLFVKIPIGQLCASFLIIWILIFLGYPQLTYFLSMFFVIGLHLMIYFFSSVIASQLLGSHASCSRKIELVATSIREKMSGLLPKIEVADPLVKGLNAFAAGPSPSKSVVILTENIENLSQDEVEAIVFHELCHIKHWHSLKLTMLNIVYLAFMYLSLIQFNIITLVFLIFLSLFTVSLVSKIFEREADIFAARIVGPAIFSSILLKVGEDAAYRMHIQSLTLGKPKPLEEIKEAIGVKRPKRFLSRFFLWIFSLHPPIYYRINTINDYNYSKRV
jgi:Zn-dependent protease with chaperone function